MPIEIWYIVLLIVILWLVKPVMIMMRWLIAGMVILIFFSLLIGWLWLPDVSLEIQTLWQHIGKALEK